MISADIYGSASHEMRNLRAHSGSSSYRNSRIDWRLLAGVCEVMPGTVRIVSTEIPAHV